MERHILLCVFLGMLAAVPTEGFTAESQQPPWLVGLVASDGHPSYSNLFEAVTYKTRSNSVELDRHIANVFYLGLSYGPKGSMYWRSQIGGGPVLIPVEKLDYSFIGVRVRALVPIGKYSRISGSFGRTKLSIDRPTAAQPSNLPEDITELAGTVEFNIPGSSIWFGVGRKRTSFDSSEALVVARFDW